MLIKFYNVGGENEGDITNGYAFLYLSKQSKVKGHSFLERQSISDISLQMLC